MIDDVHLIQQCQETLAEDVLVDRDFQAQVKDSMDCLSRVESRLNYRLEKPEKSTSVRLDNIDLRLEAIEKANANLSSNLENQNDSIFSIFRMLKEQQASPSTQYDQEDCSTKGEKTYEETIPVRQYFLFDAEEEDQVGGDEPRSLCISRGV